MRTKKASQNFIINFVTVLLGLVPVFFVRQIFLETLGTELLGLSSLYISIMGLLVLAELGITTAIIYSLYKPFAEGNQITIRGYMAFYTRFYQLVGVGIFVAGLIIMPFLNIFVKGDIPLEEARLYYLLFLINAVISYFFSARLSILIVAQEGYKLAVGMTVSKLIVAFLQILLLSVYASFAFFLIIQLLVSCIYLLFMNAYVRKKYSWLYSGPKKMDLEDKKSLLKNVKALFLHKIGEVVVFSTDNLLISYYINLTVVGIFHSYNMIITAATTMIYSGMNGLTASIGNLLVDGKEDLVYKVHKRLFFFSFWLVSFTAIAFFNTIQQFVLLWLGETQYLDRLVISLILLNFYFSLMRASVEKFKEAGGLHHPDRFAPLFEAALNLITSLLLVKHLGLPGVFIGTLLSNLAVIFWVKPLVVYKYIFKVSVRQYFLMYFKYFSLAMIPLFLSYAATKELQEIVTIEAFLLNCFINIVIINSIYLLLFRNNAEFHYFKTLVWNKLKRR